MSKLGPSARAAVILAGAGIAAFAASTAAVSSATTTAPSVPRAAAVPFAKFSYSATVSTSAPARPSTFSLTFSASFTLAGGSPAIVTKQGFLGNVGIEERVSYPVPGGRLIGPVQLPFKSEHLALIIGIQGSCFRPQIDGSFTFDGSLKCVTASLKLGIKTYRVHALLQSLTGSFMPDPTGAPRWTASLNATFKSPGYTFPVATLGSGGFTTFNVGSNGGTLRTSSITFAG
jgi:hypothetical protein